MVAAALVLEGSDHSQPSTCSAISLPWDFAARTERERDLPSSALSPVHEPVDLLSLILARRLLAHAMPPKRRAANVASENGERTSRTRGAVAKEDAAPPIEDAQEPPLKPPKVTALPGSLAELAEATGVDITAQDPIQALKAANYQGKGLMDPIKNVEVSGLSHDGGSRSNSCSGWLGKS